MFTKKFFAKISFSAFLQNAFSLLDIYFFECYICEKDVVFMKTRKMVTAAVFTALTLVATMIVQIRLTANGFVNVGDCMVTVSGIFLGPAFGAVAAGLGSVLADIIGGYFIYAPATFAIKAFMAFLTAVLFKRLKKINPVAAIAICSVVAETVMVFGYFLYEIPILGYGVALLGMPGNLLQAVFGFVCSVVLYIALSKNKYLNSQIDR